MLAVDFHVHTFFSQCGVHSHIEILTRGKELGMEGIAICDHGPSLKPRGSWVFLKRASADMVEGITMLKGMECNLLDDRGTIDLPLDQFQFMDIVLLGIHPNTPQDLGYKAYTSMLIAAIEKNPQIDILTHLNTTAYDTDYDLVVKAAAKRGIAIELNNSKTMLGVAEPHRTRDLVKAAKTHQCRIAVASDTHTINELGLDTSVSPILEELDFPKELLITKDGKTAFDFVHERRGK